MSELPPLPDRSHASVLSSRAFTDIAPFTQDSLVPRKRRYLLWGLLRTFRRDYTLLALSMFVQAAASLASPYALQNLLNYIGTKGEGAEIRPWGVLLIFIILNKC